jgi:hypothetical protein
MTPVLVQLEELLPRLPAAVDRRRLGESLGKTADALRDSGRMIGRLEAVLTIAREIQFEADPNQAAALSELIDACDDTGKVIETAETPEQLRLVQDTYREFNGALTQVDRQLRPYWRRVVERDFAPLRAIGTLLQKIDKGSDLGKRLSACGQEAQQISDKIPAENLRDAIVRLRKQRAKLEAERVSVTKEPEVEKFLNALANGTATLQMVTAQVHNWLQRYGALDQFAITPRS